MRYKKLTPLEQMVIVYKATEPPFSGQYYTHFATGTYVCKRCKLPLYSSKRKFFAPCGWPSFDEELPNAVKYQPDPDGKRTEIVCRRCNAHLGHVFRGEGFTHKDTRHCVNSVSLIFIPQKIPKG